MRRPTTVPVLAGVVLSLALLRAGAGAAQESRKPGEIQQPKGTWQQPGEIQQPKGTWQQPGEIQQPKGTWQQPGEIQKIAEDCRLRLVVAADTLFEFDRYDLTPAAAEALAGIGPALAEHAGQKIVVEGHTDSLGGDSYNQQLSERRARAVRDWLASHGHLAQTTPIRGYGESVPVAPNTHPDGSDDPDARQRNRRVEVVVQTCAKG